MTPWVLLRGLTRDARHWGSFPQALSAALGGAPVHAIDLPGNGSLHRERSPSTVAAMTEACRGQLHDRGVRPPFDVLAVSLGAMVAADWAGRHPNEVRRAVLINTSLRPPSRPHERLRPRACPALLRLALRPADPSTWERTVLELTSRRRQTDDALLAQWATWRTAAPVSRANAWRQLLAAARHRAGPRPTCRLLLLAGRGDALVSPACSRRLALQWNCRLAEHPWAGHDLTLDDPAWVLERVRQWLAEDPPA